MGIVEAREIKKYYEIKFKEDDTKTYEEWKDGIKERLADSIKAHKISDVEVGSFLSSGVDSSFIAASSDVDKTFTVGFNNEKYSEISYAKDLSSKIDTQNLSKVITKDEYFKNLPNILYYMDEPLADPSAIALYFVTKLASENVKVSLSGEGADELGTDLMTPDGQSVVRASGAFNSAVLFIPSDKTY